MASQQPSPAALRRTASASYDKDAAVRRHQERAIAALRKGEDLAPARAESAARFKVNQPRRRKSVVIKAETDTHVIKHDAKVAAGPATPLKRAMQLVAGGGAGAITKTSTAPLERVKILLQVQAMARGTAADGAAAAGVSKYRGIVGTFTTVVREEGARSLWKGNGANVLRVVPVYALKFTFNDAFRDMVRRPDQQQLTFAQMIVAGSSAGLFQACITYPLEVVRTRLTMGAGLGVRYGGIWDCAASTVRTEGAAALYKGLGPTLLSGSPYVGLQMTFYEVFKRELPPLAGAPPVGTGGDAEPAWKMACGACAGILAQTITYPGDTIRRRMQTNGMGGAPRLYRHSWDCCAQTVRNEGVRGLFHGLKANVVRSIPGAAIQFAAYDTLKEVLDCA